MALLNGGFGESVFDQLRRRRQTDGTSAGISPLRPVGTATPLSGQAPILPRQRETVPGAPNIAPPLPNIAPKARPDLGFGGGAGAAIGDSTFGRIINTPDPGRGTIGPGGFVPNQPGGARTIIGGGPTPQLPPPTGATLPGTGGGPTTPGGFRPPGFDSPGAGGGPLQEFGPGNDLRSTQINPFTGERLQGVQQGTDVLFRSLAGGPDLTQAALDKFKLLGEETAEQRQRGIRSIGQSAARLGRLNSGMVTTDLGNLEDVLRTREEQARRGLASDVAFGEGAERRANLGAGQAFEGQLFGQGQGLRQEARGERGFQEDQARQAFEQEILRRQLQAQYEQQLAALGLQGADIFGQQAAAGQQAAGNLIGGAL